MPRKTKIIFITVFILVGAIMLGLYFYNTKTSTPTTNSGTNSGYQPFLGGGTTQQDSNTGGNTNNSTGDTGTPITQDNNTPSTPQVNKFHQITNFAVSGATFFEDTRPLPETLIALPGGENPGQAVTPTQTTPATKGKTTPQKPPAPKFEIVPAIRYVERVTGHIDEMYLDTKTIGTVSNSTIPSIYEAFFDGTASSVLYRYLSIDGKTITSFLASLGSTNGEFLPSDILDVSISPDKTKFFYLTKTFSGVIGTTRSFKDTKKTQVFSSSLSEWLSQWPTSQNVYLTTKASSSVEGDLFSLNIANGVLTKIFGGVPGLTTLASTDGASVIYSSTVTGNPKLGILDVKKHAVKELNLYSLPEKCVWSTNNTIVYCAIPRDIPNGEYPDSWYQGLVSFNDNFVKINILTGQISTLADSIGESPVDATHLFLNKTETQLFFINKKDSTLWSLDLAN
jgi:hypothetical protein